MSDRPLIFIHIPKTGGVSISKALGQRLHDHYTVHAFKNPKFVRHTKFCVVRNTWDRFVSMYHYIRTSRFHQGRPIQGSRGRNTDFNEWLSENLDRRSPDFTPDKIKGCQPRDNEIGSPFWFSSQLAWISNPDGEILVRPILRFENLQEEFEALCKSQDIKVELTHENRATDRGPYRDYYSDSLRDRVAEVYDTEIQQFGFKF